jgi:glycosyltransferase involved in cell wall biosynthesis
MRLAREAKKKNNAIVISMTDNYFYGSFKQWLGAVFFRLKLRAQFDYMWVPGRRATQFMQFLGMPRERIKTGLYAADTNLFFPPMAGASRSGVVFVGQFIVRKGVENIVAAVRSPHAIKYQSSLRFIGHGPLECQLKESGVVTESFKQAAELGDVYRKASALLLPSFMDHWGVVAHEAALCGCLILATKQCGCVDDLVEHGVNGFVMENSSAEEILRSLDWLSSLTPDQQAAGRIVSIGKAAQYTPQKWAETLSEVIRRHY